MRHVLVLNRMPKNMAPYAKWFKGQDINWTQFGWQEISTSYDDHSNALFYQNYCNDLIVGDIYKHCKQQIPSAIITTSEYDVLRMAQMREAFGIPGQSVASALLFRDKIEMKKKLVAAGIRVPEFVRAQDALDVLQFIEDYGYPIIIKPVDGAGTVNVNLIRNEEQLDIFFENNSVKDLDVEVFIEGRMYAIDGFIYDGEIKVIWPHAYNSGTTLGFDKGEIMGSYMLDKDNPMTSRLIAFTKSILNALIAPAISSFHCEVFYTPGEELVLCEIACRLGGGRIVPMLNAGFGVDLYEYWVKAQAGITLDIAVQTEPEQIAAQLLYLPKAGIYHGPIIFDELDWVDELLINLQPGKIYSPSSSTDFAASAVVTGKTEKEVKEKLAKVISVLDRRMLWDNSAEVSAA